MIYPKNRVKTDFSLIPFLYECNTNPIIRSIDREFHQPQPLKENQFRCSQLAKCSQRIAYEKMEYKDQTLQLEPKSYSILSIGHIFHHFFLERISSDITIQVEKELIYEIDGIIITGHIDLIVVNPITNKIVIIDLKTCNTIKFNKYLYYPLIRDRIQVNAYWNIFNECYFHDYKQFYNVELEDFLHINYIEKQEMLMREFSYSHSKESFDWAVEKSLAIYDIVKSNDSYLKLPCFVSGLCYNCPIRQECKEYKNKK